MKGVYLTVFLIWIYPCVLSATDFKLPQCFHFTWPGAEVSKETELDCEEHNKNNPFTPCIKPLLYNYTKPNMDELWKNIHVDDNEQYIQWMEPGNVCVKFTYMYNGAVVNVSYFRGKVTEDRITPVTTGCYVKYTEGFSIEACACVSRGNNSMPCNSTIINKYSTLIISAFAAFPLLMYKIFDIP